MKKQIRFAEGIAEERRRIVKDRDYRIMILEYRDRRPFCSIFYEHFETMIDAQAKMRLLEKEQTWAGCEFRVIRFTNLTGVNELEERKGARS